MRVKDPSIRAEYSHPLLNDIECEIDDHRDQTGCIISVTQFDAILRKYQERVPVEEQSLLYDLARENFVEDDPHVESDPDGVVEGFSGVDVRPFPCYKVVLKALERHEEMWTCYDMDVHELAVRMADGLLEHDLVIEVGTDIALHQMTFEEDTTECLLTILFVLKTIVPYRDTSSWQMSVKRAEVWLHEAHLAAA